MTTLTSDQLNEWLDYNPKTGQFTWKAGRRKGKVAGYTRKKPARPYVVIQLDGQKHLAHRLAWLYMMGDWPPDEIDHINGDPTDNRWSNLRMATPSLNNHNKSYQNKTGYQGVRRYASGRCQARICKDGQRFNLPVRQTLEEAAADYQMARAALYPDPSACPPQKD